MNSLNYQTYNNVPTVSGWSPFQAEIHYPKNFPLFGKYHKYIHKSINMVSAMAPMIDHFKSVEKIVNQGNFETAIIWDNRINRKTPVILQIQHNTIILDHRYSLEFLEHTFCYNYLTRLSESFSKPIEQDVKELEQLFVKDYEFYAKNI